MQGLVYLPYYANLGLGHEKRWNFSTSLTQTFYRLRMNILDIYVCLYFLLLLCPALICPCNVRVCHLHSPSCLVCVCVCVCVRLCECVCACVHVLCLCVSSVGHHPSCGFVVLSQLADHTVVDSENQVLLVRTRSFQNFLVNHVFHMSFDQDLTDLWSHDLSPPP